MNPQGGTPGSAGTPSSAAATTGGGGGGMKLSFSMKPMGLAGAPAAKKPLPFGADDDDEDAEASSLPTTVGGVHRQVKRPRVAAPSRPAPPPPSSSAAAASGAPSPAPSASSTQSSSPPSSALAAAPSPPSVSSSAPQRVAVAPAPSPPAPPAERKEVIDKLAQYVARHGPDFEQLTRSRNEGNPKFGFLFDSAASASEETRMERAYYTWLLDEERKKVAAAAGKGPMPFPSSGGGSTHSFSSSSAAPPWRKQTPAPSPTPVYHPHPSSLPQSPPSSTRKRQFDEVGGQKRFSEDGPRATSPPASGGYRSTPLPGSSYDDDVLPQQPQHGKPGGHHIGDFLPKDELEKFLPKRAGSSAPEPTAAPAPAVESDIGKKLLQKMGWKEGTGLGSAGDGITEPIKAQVKNDKLGVGTADPSTVGESDDIYEAYKKRMMTAYRYRPNPLNNPRRQYY